MKQIGRHKGKGASTSRLPTSVPTYKINFHIDSLAHPQADTSPAKTQQRYVANTSGALPPALQNFDAISEALPDGPSLPFQDTTTGTEEAPDTIPAYETTAPCDEKGAKKRQNVAHMDELKAEKSTFLRVLLSKHHDVLLHTPCACGIGKVRQVGCADCLQSELLCRQCWLNKHRSMPTHWALVWNPRDKFFEKYDFSRVMNNSIIALGHHGQRCPDADPGRSFTLVESNGIHATAICFCRCKMFDGQHGAPEFEQLLQAGIFPGSVKEPKTWYTLGLLEFYRQMRDQGKGSAYNFVLVLQRMADPFFAGSVPVIYANFLAITRFQQELDITMHRGHAHGVEVPLAGEVGRPYPNRPIGYLGLQCAACPERGVNMPLHVNVANHLRHLISQFSTLDRNFKANLFFKRNDGSDTALTNGNMYFPSQNEFERIAKEYVVTEEDKYRARRTLDPSHARVTTLLRGSFVDMLKGEAFALGTYAQREYLRHTNSPPHGRETSTPTVFSYDSYCSFVVNEVNRAIKLFPEELWLHTLLAAAEGQIPADHINGHGLDCQTRWQAVYFACRAHFHGETAEVLWAFLNPLGSSTRQMTGAARHDTINFVMDAWNTWKVLPELLAAERLDALRLFELHMAIVEDLSRQHATQVAEWSQMLRITTKSAGGKFQSVYQHKTTKVLTLDHMLASMVAEERKKLAPEDDHAARTLVSEWIHAGMRIEREQMLVIELLKNHREHPKEETWGAITKLRDTLNLSALDVDEPELTAIQLPSYRMKHGQRVATGAGADKETQLREAEVKLRCSEADSGILAVQAASLALSAVKKARDLDYRGQAGITRSQRNLQKADLLKTYEIIMYNRARGALIHLGHMAKEDVEPYPPLSHHDTRRKETHLHRAKGDSRLFDGTAWYLQSGVTISRAAVNSTLSPINGYHDGEEDEPQLLSGTQTLKRTGFKKSQRAPRCLRDIAPENVVVESSASEAEDSEGEASPLKAQRAKKPHGKKAKKSDGWIWLESVTRSQVLGEEKLAEYKRESDRVQWFRAEAEMYRRLEQYERKHVELMRVITRFRRDTVVWAGLGDREELQVGCTNGAVSYARMQAAMYKRLEHNAKMIFKSAESGAHHDWVSAESFDELVTKIDGWRDVVFKWMDDMGIHRAYKDF
ncbi:hypothetical protein C8J57DRAFT_1612009 [Mycena rebaudengoi]|nr:hypothetical protein C8J57DRAFT_1612009 [Mycena rebaudengoi]